MNFPSGFREKYERVLGEEAQAFFESFDRPAQSGFRINPLKASVPNFADSIDKMPWSYYGKVSGKSIAHATGVVYSQEPAAQVVGHVASPSKGMKVLDLAAAPGGKTTHLLSYLDNTGLLVSNEISTKRSKILVENVERFGARNVIVTNESAENLAKVFPAYFDVIVLDAPCSGEGMFRKDPAAMEYWTEDYPAQCANLQRDILGSAITMLAPNGRLVYSTCTWSPEENEEVVRWLLEEYDMDLLPIESINGMVDGIDMSQAARMYPHRFQGEGQFVAHLQAGEQGISSRFKPAKQKISREQESLWQTFAKQHLAITLDGVLQVFGDQLYLLPNGLPDLSGIRIARNGLHLGTFKTKRFEPSFALGLALRPQEVKQTVVLDEEKFPSYVAGETVSVDTSLPNGWYQIICSGNGLGFAKVVNGVLKNAYPKGLRFR